MTAHEIESIRISISHIIVDLEGRGDAKSATEAFRLDDISNRLTVLFEEDGVLFEEDGVEEEFTDIEADICDLITELQNRGDHASLMAASALLKVNDRLNTLLEEEEEEIDWA
jgi:hypothetical protein